MLYNSKNNPNNNHPIIVDRNYNLFSIKDFFGINDVTRLIILIFIFISLILNIIIVTILIKRKKSNKKSVFSLSGILTLNILIVNFLHTISYIFNWVIKNDTTEFHKPNKIPINVGGLLVGNPSNYKPCLLQGFLLIFFSMSQDFIINIFFAFVNMDGKEKRFIFILVILIAGYIFPFCITLIYSNLKLIGINEKVCYIAKYSYKIDDKTGEVQYFPEKNYNYFKAIIFSIRGLNLILTLFFIIRAIRYIQRSEKKDRKADKLISSLPVISVAFFTLSIYLIFRIVFFVDSRLEEKYMDIYLLLNSVDAVLLPIVFFINHGIYRYFCCCCPEIRYESDNYDNDTSIKDEIILENIIPKDEKKENKE